VTENKKRTRKKCANGERGFSNDELGDMVAGVQRGRSNVYFFIFPLFLHVSDQVHQTDEYVHKPCMEGGRLTL